MRTVIPNEDYLEIKKFHFDFKLASIKIRSNKKLVLEEVFKNPDSLKYVSEELKNDKEFLYEIKDMLEKKKLFYVETYELLKKYERYEREDYLNSQLVEKETNISKIKKKI